MTQAQSTEPSKAGKIGVVLGVLTLVATLINGVPSFLALRSKAADVTYDFDESHIALPDSADKRAVRALLAQNKIPDSYGTVRITNQGNVSAREVLLSIDLPGPLIADKAIPSIESKPPWTSSISREVLQQPDGHSILKYRIQDLAVGPEFKIDYSYEQEIGSGSSVAVFSDGHSALRASVSKEAKKTPTLWPALVILLGGLLFTTSVYVALRTPISLLTHPLFVAILSLLPPQFSAAAATIRRSKWQGFKDKVLLQLAGINGVILVSSSNGAPRSRKPQKFWDGIFEVKNVGLVAIDVHTSSQESGFFGTELVRNEFALRVIEMTKKTQARPLFVSNRDWSNAGLREFQVLLQNCARHGAVTVPLFLSGEPAQIAEQFAAAFNIKTRRDE